MTLPAPTDPEPELLSLPSGPVAFTDEGPPQGPACILLHGAPGSVRDFRYLAPALALKGLRAIRIDLPGFGGTPRSTWPELSGPARAAFVAEVAARLGLRRFSVIGLSIGGPTALFVAAAGGERISALGLINSIGTLRHRGMRLPEPTFRLVGKALAVPGLEGRLVAVLREAYRAQGFRDVEKMDADALRVLMDLISSLDFLGHRRAARAVKAPVLVASSEDDPLIEPRVSFALADAFSPLALVRHLHFGRGGHALQKHEAARIARHFAEMLPG